MRAAGLEEGDPPKERREEEAWGLGWMLLALLIKGGGGQTKEGVSGEGAAAFGRRWRYGCGFGRGKSRLD